MSETERDVQVFDTADAEAAFEAAADAIASGQVIVLPTDTVYGVGADPFSPAAVQRLLDAKRRGRDMPPPVLVAEVEMVRSLVSGFDERAEAIARAFWPGPLTLIAAAPDSLRMDLGERGSTIAVRVPDHEFTRELLRRTGPLAVSSANLNGREAALTIDEAVDQLGDSVAVYLDAGTMSGPVPSTIIDLSGVRPRLLRKGRLTVAEINAVVPGLLVDPDAVAESDVVNNDAPDPDAVAEPATVAEPDAGAEPGAVADPDAAAGDPTPDAEEKGD